MAIRVGVVGWGEIGACHAEYLVSAGAQFNGVVSRRSGLKLEVPVYSTLRDMLPHVDAVTIAVPNFLHASLCLEVAHAGKAVLVEKPLCICREELEMLETALPKATAPVHLGYRLRWNPSMMKLRERIQGLRRIRCIYRLGIEQLADGKDWTRDSVQSGGGFFTLGVHALDLARWLAGANGVALSNVTAHAGHRDDSANFPLMVSISGTLPSGVEIVAGTDLRGDADTEIIVEVDAENGGYPDPSLPAPRLEDEKIEYEALFRHFVQAVEQGRVDGDYIEEVLQTHRELINAQEFVTGQT